MRIHAVQQDIVWEDKPANHARLAAMLDDAGVSPGDLVVLAEMSDTGFSFDLGATVDDRSLAWATDQARGRGVWLVMGHSERFDLADRPPGRNAASVIDPAGRVVGTYHKVHPFSFGREADYFAGGSEVLLVRLDDAPADGADAADDRDAGPLLSPLVCYDLRFPELFRHAALAGAEVISVGANWPAARQAHWRTMLIARAIENQAIVVGVNRCGNDPHIEYAGGSIIVGPQGEILAEAGDTETVLTVEPDLAAVRAWRDRFPALRDARRSLLGSVRVIGDAPRAIAGRE